VSFSFFLFLSMSAAHPHTPHSEITPVFLFPFHPKEAFSFHSRSLLTDENICATDLPASNHSRWLVCSLNRSLSFRQSLIRIIPLLFFFVFDNTKTGVNLVLLTVRTFFVLHLNFFVSFRSFSPSSSSSTD